MTITTLIFVAYAVGVAFHLYVLLTTDALKEAEELYRVTSGSDPLPGVISIAAALSALLWPVVYFI